MFYFLLVNSQYRLSHLNKKEYGYKVTLSLISWKQNVKGHAFYHMLHNFDVSLRNKLYQELC
jgi:hypothetical protein